MAEENINIKPSNQTQYYEPRHPILYIALYSIGSTLCILAGLTLFVLSLVGLGLIGGSSYVTLLLILIIGGAIAIIGPLIIIFFFLKTFKASRFKKYYLIFLIAIPAILILIFIFFVFYN